MSIISVRDNENNRWNRNTKKTTNKQTNKQHKQTNTEKNKGERRYSEWAKAKWLCCTFKSGFTQLIYKASLIFKSNLDLALSVILKENYIRQSMFSWSVDV